MIYSWRYTIARNVRKDIRSLGQKNVKYHDTKHVKVRMSQILGNNQPDALFSCIYLFRVSTCFERHSALHQEIELY